MAELTGTNDAYDLGSGITLIAPGVVGRATYDGTTPAPITPSGQLFDDALGNAGIVRRAPIVITHSSSATDPVKVQFPAPPAGWNALLIVHDSTGGLTWHQPETETVAVAEFKKGNNSGAGKPVGDLTPDGPPLSFVLHPGRFAHEKLAAGLERRAEDLLHHFEGHRGLRGVRKALSVLEYPIGHLAAVGAKDWFDHWDRNKHPTVIRWFPPKHQLALGEPLSPTNWDLLRSERGPVLLFVHGIFSSCNGAFGDLADPDDANKTWPALINEYKGRVIGFDHPTAAVGPEKNAQDFLALIPEGIHLDVDIVCHSRGGLVSRALAGQLPTTTSAGEKLTVRKIIFAATPNGGTQITETAHWAYLVDRITSLLTLPEKFLPSPADAIVGLVASVLELIKVVAVGVALDLPGLEDMRPESALLTELARWTGPTPEYYAAASDFEPGPFLAHVFNRARDLGDIVDEPIFAKVHNDVAVPTNGVFDPRNADGLNPAPVADPIPGFPITDETRILHIEGDKYWHGAYFKDQRLRDKLVEWLVPEPA